MSLWYSSTPSAHCSGLENTYQCKALILLPAFWVPGQGGCQCCSHQVLLTSGGLPLFAKKLRNFLLAQFQAAKNTICVQYLGPGSPSCMLGSDSEGRMPGSTGKVSPCYGRYRASGRRKQKKKRSF